MGDITVRRARPVDADAVAAFTADTWGDRHDDYLPRVFAEWVASDDDTQRTFVATVAAADAAATFGADAAGGGSENDDVGVDGAGVDDTTVVSGDGTGSAAAGEPEIVVGCVQGVLLSDWESWAQGIRVNPIARGLGVGSRLSEAVLDWAAAAGATVCRNMVFSWNVAGLGQSRAVGFDPSTEFRFARPDPAAAPAALPDLTVDDPDPDAVWAFWSRSDARDHLGGLGLDPGESWSCSQLTRDRVATASDEGRLVAVVDDGLVGFALHTRTWEREADDGSADDQSADDGSADDQSVDGGAGTSVADEPPVERHAIYGSAAWRDAAAAGALLDAVAWDAADRDADHVRVFIPETVDHVSDVAANRVEVSAEPDFVMAADLTDR